MSPPEDPMNRIEDDRSADGPDPELVELPRPHRPFRRLTLLSLATTALCAAAFVVGLSGDIRYAVSAKSLSDIGALAGFRPQANHRNGWVRGDGELESVGGIRFERPLESDSFRLAPVQGNPKLWVQLRVPAGYENEHFVAPTVFAGRLVPRSALGLRYSTLAVAPEDAGWQAGHLPDDAWLLIDGESPENARWVIGLAVLFVGFVTFALWALYSLLRPISADLGSLRSDATPLEPS